MKVIKVAIITTLDHNIGDDFVRVGIQELTNNLLKGQDYRYVLINKHDPMSAFNIVSPNYYLKFLTRFLPGMLRKFTEDFLAFVFWWGHRFKSCDFIIQSGAPVYFKGCNKTEWSYIIWKKAIAYSKYKNGPVLMNIAAGSCYVIGSQFNQNIQEGEKRFIKLISDSCKINTAREKFAEEIVKISGGSSKLLPCTAFLAGRGFISSANSDSPILINFMPVGGHYDFKGNINTLKYMEEFNELIVELSKKHKLVFVAHGQEEFDFNKKHFNRYEHFYPKSVNEYIDIASSVKFAVTNRLHCSVLLAGLGIKSYAIGNDTRLLMLDELDLNWVSIHEFSSNSAFNKINESLEIGVIFDSLIAKREFVFEEYTALLKNYI